MLPSSPPFKKMKTEHGDVITSHGESTITERAYTFCFLIFLILLRIHSICADHRHREQMKLNNSNATMDYKQPILDPASSINLIDLNDDCLYSIFDLVSIVDLIALARSCNRLNVIGTRIFERKHKICDFSNMAVEHSVVACGVFNTFGSFIADLRIDLSLYTFGAVKIIDSMVQNCNVLKSLTIKSYTVPDNQDDITKLGMLFEKLEVLRLEYVYVEGFEELNEMDVIVTPNGNLLNLFTNCKSLIDFKILCSCNFKMAIFESGFPELQHFEYDIGEGYTDCKVTGFILRHRNLKSFSLNTRDIQNAAALKVIAANCKSLEKLKFETDAEPDDTALMCVEKLQQLTELKILWIRQNVTRLITKFRPKSLTVLNLQYIEGGPELIPAISQIKTLRVLKLLETDPLYDLNPLGELKQLIELSILYMETTLKFDFIKLVERLVNLKKFKFITSGFTIGTTSYIRLVNVIKHRPEIENRYLELRCPTTNDFDDGSLCQTVKIIRRQY